MLKFNVNNDPRSGLSGNWKSGIRSSWKYWLLFFIVLLGAMLRLYDLEATGLWMDEIHSAIGADPEKSVKEVLEYCKQDQPPLSFLLLHSWYTIFGYGDFSGRLFGVLTGLLGIICIYFVGVEFKNWKVGLFSSFLTAINYFHIDYSRQVRFYPLVFLLSSLSYLFFLRALKNRRPGDFVLYALFTAALLNTHYFGMVVFASQFLIFIIVIFLNRIYDFKFILWSLLSATFAGLSFLHWIPVVLSDLEIPSYHLSQVKWYFPFQYYFVYFRDVVTCAICGILSFIAILEMVGDLKKRPVKLEYFVLLTWLLFSFLIPIFYSLLKIPMLEYKYTFIALPAIFLLAAFGLDSAFLDRLQLNVKIGLKAPLSVIMVSLFLANAFFFKKLYIDRHPWQSWREVTRAVMSNDSKDQVVLSNYTWYFRYYFKIYESASLIIEPRYVEIKKIEQATSLWVIKSSLFPDQGIQFEQQSILARDFELVESRKFEDFLVEHFVKRN